MSISLAEIRGTFTIKWQKAYKEKVKVPSFMRTFYTTKTTTAKQIGYEEKRTTEKIALDVARGTNGNRNQHSFSTQKIVIPPYFAENIDFTSLERYERVFGENPDGSAKTLGWLADDLADEINDIRDKIERAKEKMCSQVFDTGIVTMNNGDNVDFKRKAGSMVDLTGTGYWSNTNAPVENQLIAGAEFIRNNGKNGTAEFNLVMPGTGWTNLKKTDFFTNMANWRQVRLIDINMPQKAAFGPGYHGTVSAGAYIFHIWTYDEVYTNASDVITRYWPSDSAFMVPVKGTRFDLAHAGVPAIMRDKNNAEFPKFIAHQASDYWINNYVDETGKSHTFEVSSAPLPIPRSVDMIYTMTILNVANPDIG